MTKTADTGLTIVFLVYFSYYTLMGFVWGGMSGEIYMPFVLTTFLGLVLILVSVTTKSKDIFTVTRIVGLYLVPFLIYFDIGHSFAFDTKWELIKAMLTYLPTILFLIYLFYSTIRLTIIIRQKSS